MKPAKIALPSPFQKGWYTAEETPQGIKITGIEIPIKDGVLNFKALVGCHFQNPKDFMFYIELYALLNMLDMNVSKRHLTEYRFTPKGQAGILQVLMTICQHQSSDSSLDDLLIRQDMSKGELHICIEDQQGVCFVIHLDMQHWQPRGQAS